MKSVFMRLRCSLLIMLTALLSMGASDAFASYWIQSPYGVAYVEGLSLLKKGMDLNVSYTTMVQQDPPYREACDCCADSGGMMGDVDHNGTVNVNDVLYIMRHVLYISTLDEAGIQVADVNDDGTVNINDAVKLLRHVLNIIQTPLVRTCGVTDVTGATAEVSGCVTPFVDVDVTTRGVCWSTEHNPTLESDHSDAGEGTGEFTSSLTGLTANTTYYVRAYAANSVGTSYGEELSFTTQTSVSTGFINGKFTVNADGDQVYFSQGNLQYIGNDGTPYWKFADNQWECLADENATDSPTANRDLFGWGTSGYHDASDSYNMNYLPWSTSSETVSEDYNYYGYGPSTNMASPNLTGSSANYDWAVYNPIMNGGNQAGLWCTLTHEEWTYVFETRSTTSGIRYAKAKVNYVNGVILLPDDWSNSYYSLSNTNDMNVSFSSNTISSSVWASSLEVHGAVFLPAAGGRDGTSVDAVDSFGGYWSASCRDSYDAWGVYFSDLFLYSDYDRRYFGYSVRLVVPVENVIDMLSPTVITSEVIEITDSSATCSGNVIDDGGAFVTARGICWSTEQNPTIESDHTTEGEGTGEFTSIMTGLTSNTTYYVRAYATNSVGTSYGEEASFTTLSSVPAGAINSKFTVNADGDQVYFSQGNLQYIGSAATSYWKFADNQWDILGTETGQNSADENVDRDLLGWGTSGYYYESKYHQPWLTSTQLSDYYAYGDDKKNLYDETGLADWGSNTILNGSNDGDVWRTLTMEEWTYLLDSRTTESGSRYAKAIVNGVNGVVLLPDNWNDSIYSLNNINAPKKAYNSNTITDTIWNTIFQPSGAIFLPAAGSRNGSTLSNEGTYGYYWSSSNGDYFISSGVDENGWPWGHMSDGGGAHYFYFKNNELSTDEGRNYFGYSVRLVRPITTAAPTVQTNPVAFVTHELAEAGGNVVDDGNVHVRARGVCWSTSPNPTINDEHTIDGGGTGSFNSVLTGLIINTTYYMRAYATNGLGTTYGDEICFKTSEHDYPTGATGGIFSVSATQQVYFSQGNLQRNDSTDILRFAANQFDYIGEGNLTSSPNYNGWIDMFTLQFGRNVSNKAISNGGNKAGLWRTLSSDQWRYLMDIRTTESGIRYAKAVVNGVNGVIIVPDNWSEATYMLNDTNSKSAPYSTNTISVDVWASVFESVGAVFLPAAGYSASTSQAGYMGYYHSTSEGSNYTSYYLYFSEDDLQSNGHGYSGYNRSLRLVYDLELE